MRIRYSPQAKSDLADIAAYLRPRNRAAAKRRVRESSQRSLRHLTAFAELGRVQDEGVRKIVEPGFGYLIYYHIDKVSNVVNVVTIQHPKRDRPYTDK
jgi:plasmid stabilization system protein ParE